MAATRINSTDYRSCVLAAIYSKMITGYSAIQLLCSSNFGVEGEIVCRSICEALFYMGMCALSEDSYKQYMNNDLHGLRKLRNKLAKNDSNHYSKSLRKELENIFKENETQLESIPTEELKVKQASEITKLEVFYDYPYHLLSKAIHSSASYIFSNYIRHSGAEINGVCVGPNPNRSNDALFGSTLIMLQAYKIFCDHMDIPLKADMLAFHVKYARYSQ